MRAEYFFTIRWHAPPNLQGVINYKPVRISDSIWQHITASTSNNLHAFTAIVDQLTVFFWVYMPCDKLSNLSEARTLSPGSKPCSGGCWISWEGKNVSICAHYSLPALTRASKSLSLYPSACSHSSDRSEVLPTTPHRRHIRSFSTSTVFTWITFTHLEDWASRFFQNT